MEDNEVLFSKDKNQKFWLIVVLFLVIGISLSFLVFHIWVQGADHRDFYPLWAGARLALFEREDLYSLEATQTIQVKLYGQVLPAGQDQQGFAYPATSLIFFLPFIIINNVEIATAAWIGFSIILTYSTLRLLGRMSHHVPFWTYIIFLLWYFSLINFFQGQTIALMIASLGISFWAYNKRYHSLSGAVLAIGLIKPGTVLLPVLIILFLAVRESHYNVLIAFLLANITLVLLSFALAGYWLPGWLQALQRYSQYAKPVWPLRVLWGLSPLIGAGILLVSGVLLFILRSESIHLFAASIPLGMLLLPQTLIWGLAMMLIPFILLWHGKNRYLIIVAWVLGWLSILGNIYLEKWWYVQSLVIPLLSLGIIIFSYLENEKEPFYDLYA